MFASCLQVTTIVFVIIVTWLSSRTRLHDCHRGSLDHRQHQHHWTLSPGCPQGTGWPPGRCSPQLPELESSTEASRPMWVSPDLWFNLELVIRSNRPLSQSSDQIKLTFELVIKSTFESVIKPHLVCRCPLAVPLCTTSAMDNCGPALHCWCERIQAAFEQWN